jgi:hypothetical protein
MELTSVSAINVFFCSADCMVIEPGVVFPFALLASSLLNTAKITHLKRRGIDSIAILKQ